MKMLCRLHSVLNEIQEWIAVTWSPTLVIAVPLKIARQQAVAAVAGQDALARAIFKAAVHHSRSSMIAPAGASSSASPASTSPPW